MNTTQWKTIDMAVGGIEIPVDMPIGEYKKMVLEMKDIVNHCGGINNRSVEQIYKRNILYYNRWKK